MPLTESQFLTIAAAAAETAHKLASIVRDAVVRNGKATLAVSGGNTPPLVFKHLYREDLDWSKVTVTLTDDRWVSVNDPDSNERLVREHLLKGPARFARFLPLYGGEASPEAGLLACEARLASIEDSIDVVYLGMGCDGHIASLFPGEECCHSQRATCVAVPALSGRLPRISLSIDKILNAKEILLLYSGADKHAAYLVAKGVGDSSNHALRTILAQQCTPVSVLRA